MLNRHRRREARSNREGAAPRWPKQWKLLAVWGAPLVLVAGLTTLIIVAFTLTEWHAWWGWLVALWIIVYLVLLVIARSYNPMPR